MLSQAANENAMAELPACVAYLHAGSSSFQWDRLVTSVRSLRRVSLLPIKAVVAEVPHEWLAALATVPNLELRPLSLPCGLTLERPTNSTIDSHWRWVIHKAILPYAVRDCARALALDSDTIVLKDPAPAITSLPAPSMAPYQGNYDSAVRCSLRDASSGTPTLNMGNAGVMLLGGRSPSTWRQLMLTFLALGVHYRNDACGEQTLLTAMAGGAVTCVQASTCHPHGFHGSASECVEFTVTVRTALPTPLLWHELPCNVHLMGPWTGLPPTLLSNVTTGTAHVHHEHHRAPYVLHRCCGSREGELRAAELALQRQLLMEASHLGWLAAGYRFSESSRL